MSTRINQTIWQTKVDDRVLCSRFTNDGRHFLIGTGGTSSLYPLVLFDTEKAQPIHVSPLNEYERKASMFVDLRCKLSTWCWCSMYRMGIEQCFHSCWF